MPQPASQTFQGIAGPHDGPFSDYLRPVQPRPIDTLPPPGQATGYESGPVGAGQIALQFLQGIRKNRVADFLEQDKNVENQLNNYRQYVNSRLQDPDLTEEGRQAILSQANQTMNEHMHYEMRDVPKHGIAGFFKNVLTQLSGGPIKTREPINWDQATGQITNLIKPEHSQKYNYQQALNEASQGLQQLRESGQPVMPQQVSNLLAPLLSKVAMTAPNYVDVFQATVKGLAPGDPYADAMLRKKLEILQLTQGGAGQPMPATQAPPEMVDRGIANVLSPGQIMPPANVRPADTAAPPAMNLHDPINRSVLKDMGYKIEEPTTLYNPKNLREYAPNAMRSPFTGQWVGDNNQPLPPEMQAWVPHDQIKMPPVAEEAVIAGSPNVPGGPSQFLLLHRGTGEVRPATMDKQPVYGTTTYEETIGPNGRTVLVPKAPGVVPAPPQENPGAAQARVRETAALRVVGEARAAYPNDPDKQREFVAASPVTDDVRGRASEMLGATRPKSAVEKLIEEMKGTAPAAGPASTPPPARTAPPAATTTPAPGARGLIRRQ